MDMEGTASEQFVEQVKESGDLEKAGTALASFEDVPIQVPRGRYEVEMFDKYMKLHGKTFDYKVMYSNVGALYLLPKPDGYHMALCITLENPLRQGQTTYPHVVLQLPKDTPMEVTINLEEQEIQERFGDKLDQSEAGDMPSVLAKVFSAFTKRKIITLKKDGFNGGSKAEDDRATSIRCSVKANEGQLYPLDKSFFFIANKPMLVEFEKVGSIEFNRVTNTQSSARTFDITVHMKDMSGPHQFVNLQRSVYKELYRFLTEKKIRIKNIAAASGFGDEDGDDADDADDPYMNTLQRERDEAEAGDDDDDDDESDDEDFAPGGESDVDEEFDEGDVNDDERAGPMKKGGGGGGSDDDSGGDGEDDGDEDEEESRPLKKAKKEPKEAKPKKERKTKEPTDEKGKKKKRAKKDKDAPKNALSAYMIFMNRNRDKIKAANPEASFGEIGKIAGAQWKAIDAADKVEYEDAANEEKARYAREVAAYKERLKAAAADDDDEDDAGAGGDSPDEDVKGEDSD